MMSSCDRWRIGTCLVVACACTSVKLPVLVDAGLLPIARDRQWSEPRTPLALSGGQASDCRSYTRLRSTGVVESVSNQLVKSEYLICDVLEELGPAPDLKELPAGHYGEALASRLDLRSFPSSLGPMVDDERYTLSRLFNGEVEIGGNKAAVKSSTVSFSLSVVVVGDLDRSGGQDWLVWLTDEVPDGTYRGYETLLIHDVKANGLLMAHRL